MAVMLLQLFLVWQFLQIFLYNVQYVYGSNISHCEPITNCNDCFNQDECIWCRVPAFDNVPQCLSKSLNIDYLCKKVYSPKSEVIYKDEPPFGLNEEFLPIIFKPQTICSCIRRQAPINLKFHYIHSAKIPLDVYFVIALNDSNTKHINTIVENVSSNMVRTLWNLTMDLMVGFGHIIETPYRQGDLNEIFLSFYHGQSLTNQYKNFMEALKTKEFHASDDQMEDIDSLMRALLSRENMISWRQNSIRLLIFISDHHLYKFHQNVNTISGRQPLYPSQYELIKTSAEGLQTNNASGIFIPVGNLKNFNVLQFGDLDQIRNMHFVEGDNLVDKIAIIIRNNYLKMAMFSTNESIILYKPNDLNLRYEIVPNCTNRIANGCTNLIPNEVVTFNIRIVLNTCHISVPLSRRTTFISNHPKVTFESIVKINCGCDCQKNEEKCDCNETLYAISPPIESELPSLSAEEVLNLENRNMQSECKCGECTSPEWCSCTKWQNCSLFRNTLNCTVNGISKCGMCQCKIGEQNGDFFYGKHCEYDYSTKNFLPKSAPCNDHGSFEYQKCSCIPGWRGENCELPDFPILSCIGPDSSENCSGFGICNFGICTCIQGRHGDFCQFANLTINKYRLNCIDIGKCLECKNVAETKCPENCIYMNIKMMEENSSNESLLSSCTVSSYYRDECILSFQYSMQEHDTNIQVAMDDREQCAASNSIHIRQIFLILSGILFLLFLLVFGLWYISRNARIQSQKINMLENDEDLKWQQNDNPLFKSAITSYTNPMFEPSN